MHKHNLSAKRNYKKESNILEMKNTVTELKNNRSSSTDEVKEKKQQTEDMSFEIIEGEE